jgi:hypothetical protein
MPLSAKDREWLGSFLGPITRAAKCCCPTIESVPICITVGEDCFSVFAIYSHTEEGSTLLRVQDASGTIVTDPYTITACTGECETIYVVL